MYNMYYKNGVIVTPNVVADGDNLTITYKGLLYNDGAHSVLMHTGYGEDWKDTKDVRMEKTYNGFEAKLPVKSHEKLNMVFKDCAGNWDNNSGRNYSFEVQADMKR